MRTQHTPARGTDQVEDPARRAVLRNARAADDLVGPALAGLSRPTSGSLLTLQSAVGNSAVISAMNGGSGAPVSAPGGTRGLLVQRARDDDDDDRRRRHRSKSHASSSRRTPSRSRGSQTPEYEHLDISYTSRDTMAGVPHGPRRPDQNTVMGGSASDAMKASGVHPGGTTSWLHAAAAWHHGDAVHGTPQRADNLVAGTQATNMEHLRWESALSEPARDDKGKGKASSKGKGKSSSSKSKSGKSDGGDGGGHFAGGVDMLGTPVTQMAMNGRVPGGKNVFREAKYMVHSPYDPRDMYYRKLDPLDPRSVGDREKAGDLPSRESIHRQSEAYHAQFTMNALPHEAVPSEYRDWEQSRGQSSAPTSSASGAHIRTSRERSRESPAPAPSGSGHRRRSESLSRSNSRSGTPTTSAPRPDRSRPPVANAHLYPAAGNQASRLSPAPGYGSSRSSRSGSVDIVTAEPRPRPRRRDSVHERDDRSASPPDRLSSARDARDRDDDRRSRGGYYY
ncbi:hypothetical protein [Streptomyces sp. NPDC093109]|uniref:hypothetical protein n=1 Tax=Streptomyces sp. NPDC093109 TaxID=3154977 RepID=UPI00344C5331